MESSVPDWIVKRTPWLTPLRQETAALKQYVLSLKSETEAIKADIARLKSEERHWRNETRRLKAENRRLAALESQLLQEIATLDANAKASEPAERAPA